MKKVSVTLGQDLAAYAEIEVEVNGASKDDVLKAIKSFVESDNFDDVVFDEDWSTVSSLRVVSARNGNDYILEDVFLEPSPYDAGQVLMSWLRGHGPTFQAVINSAVEARLIDEPVMEAHRGKLKLPGAKAIEIEFECRKGATREEKDLAFIEALAQIGNIDYVAIGEVCQECRHNDVCPGTLC